MRNNHRSARTAFTIGLMFVAIVIALGIITTALTACDDRKTIHCKDGTISSGTNTQGKCSGHGGIDHTS